MDANVGVHVHQPEAMSADSHSMQMHAVIARSSRPNTSERRREVAGLFECDGEAARAAFAAMDVSTGAPGPSEVDVALIQAVAARALSGEGFVTEAAFSESEPESHAAQTAR